MNDRIKERNRKILNKLWNETKRLGREGKRVVGYYAPRVHSYTERLGSDVQETFRVRPNPNAIQPDFSIPNNRYIDLTKKQPTKRRKPEVDWNNLGVNLR
jgi:hypothetical protein